MSQVASYMVLWKANASVWPTDPKQNLAVLEMAMSGADQLLAGGALNELGWFTPQEGYAVFEAASKDAVMAMVAGFFPYNEEEIREIVPWEQGKQAVLGSARQMASH